jgi:hypothetical protein
MKGLTMQDSYSQAGDRRKSLAVPEVPFVDGNGVTVREDRRKVPDRRYNRTQAEWIDELLLGS